MRHRLFVLTRRTASDADTAPLADSELDMLRRELGLAGRTLSTACVRAAARGWPDGTSAICADPVTLAATLDDLVFADVVRDLDAAERNLLTDLVASVAADRLRRIEFGAYSEGLALLTQPADRGLPDPARLAGRALRAVLANSKAPAVLRTLDAELQMALHESPLNAARSARGRAPISAVWFWGGGPATEIVSERLPALYAHDATLAGFWQLTGNGERQLPTWQAALAAGGSAVLAPTHAAECDAIMAALARRSRITRWRQTLTLLGADGSTQPLPVPTANSAS
ncbi:MAG: hypothetical protein AAFX44_16945 [Pseudomonadota bacterium]